MILTCIFFFSLKKKGLFVRHEHYFAYISMGRAESFFFPEEPWSPKSYQDFRETSPWTDVVGHPNSYASVLELNIIWDAFHSSKN